MPDAAAIRRYAAFATCFLRAPRAMPLCYSATLLLAIVRGA